MHGLLVELLFGEPMQEIDRIEDASTASCYFGITQPLCLIDKFLFTAACIDQMGMRVAEAWHHRATFGIDDLEVFCFGYR